MFERFCMMQNLRILMQSALPHEMEKLQSQFQKAFESEYTGSAWNDLWLSDTDDAQCGGNTTRRTVLGEESQVRALQAPRHVDLGSRSANGPDSRKSCAHELPAHQGMYSFCCARFGRVLKMCLERPFHGTLLGTHRVSATRTRRRLLPGSFSYLWYVRTLL